MKLTDKALLGILALLFVVVLIMVFAIGFTMGLIVEVLS